MKSLLFKMVLAVIATFSTINILTHVQANTIFEYESSLFTFSSNDVITQSSDDALIEDDSSISFSSDDVINNSSDDTISNSSDDVISNSSDDSIQTGVDYQYWGYKETTDTNKTWAITLSKAVQSVSVIDPPIYVSNSLGESIPVTVDVNGNMISVTPVQSYEKGSVYSLWIPQSVSSLEGELLPLLVKMDFIVK